MPQDLHILPRIRDSWSYLYVDHAKIDQDEKAIAIHDVKGKTCVPCAQLHALLLGPGTTITHAAIRVLVDCGCTIIWTGEYGVRCYAQGLGETRSSQRLIHQVQLWANPESHLAVVRAMYQFRFPEPLDTTLTLQQIRGKEGIRVRKAYTKVSEEYGVPWQGRNYEREDWKKADPINRALSVANSCLYGVCHAAIVAAGYSPALGFVHTGKQLSFVYDIGDLYKMEVSVPAAFAAVSQGTEELERRVRLACRDEFHKNKILARIVEDIDKLLKAGENEEDSNAYNEDGAKPGELWNPNNEITHGGVNFADGEEAFS